MSEDLHDQPDPKAVVGALFSQVAAEYDQGIDFFERFGRSLVAAANLERGADVLDLAAGRGACLFPALESVGPEGSVLGIDLAEGMVKLLAAEVAARRIANAEVRQGDAEALDLPSGSVDAVTGGFMIFFLPNPYAAIEEIHRVLKPGGTVALSIFDGVRPSSWLQEVAADILGEQPEQPTESFDDADVLDAALVRAGFGAPEATIVTERFVFPTLDDVERWHRSHFARHVIDQFDAAGLATYRERMALHLASTEIDGGFEMIQPVRLTVAHRP